MTRSSEAALDESQLALGQRCEGLLSAPKWHRAHTVTHKGLMLRLAMIKDAGLPAMRVVPNQALQRLGRIPRSHEGHQVDALDAVRKAGADINNKPKAVVLFYSHRWKRPNWCESRQIDLPWSSPERQQAMQEGATFGDPDDAEHSKARALVEYAAWFKRRRTELADQSDTADITQAADLEIFWWIDWACTDQDNPGPDMAALPAYAAACAGIVVAWSDEYAGRAWCQVEMLVAYAFMSSGNMLFVVPDGFGRGSTRPLRFEREALTVPNPAQGALTNDNDRPVIESLTRVAQSSQAFSCWRVFVKNSTLSCRMCFVWNVCCCCQWCGLIALGLSRNVQPGRSKVDKLLPVDDTAPSNAAMARARSPATRVAPL